MRVGIIRCLGGSPNIQCRTLSVKPLPLISDPFNLSTTKRIRETHNKFPKPEFISFDIFGTLYSPKISVPEQYYEISTNEFNFNKSLQSIEKDFPIVYAELSRRYPNYGKDSADIESPDDWWSELIIRLFKLPHFSHDGKSKEFCFRLIDHFKGSDAYSLYHDVIPTLTKLVQQDVNIVVASNSDPRVSDVIENLGLSDLINKSNVYLSYDLGYSKPDRNFFNEIVNKFLEKKGTHSYRNRSDYLGNCWHVGDIYEKDFLGAVKAGWNGIFLDRDRSSPFFSETAAQRLTIENEYGCGTQLGKEPLGAEDQELILLSNNRAVITSLTKILELFDFEPNQPSRSGNYNEI